jgi:hypothetical protein
MCMYIRKIYVHIYVYICIYIWSIFRECMSPIEINRDPVRRRRLFTLTPKIWIRLVLSTQDDIFCLSYDTVYQTTAKMYHLECA